MTTYALLKIIAGASAVLIFVIAWIIRDIARSDEE